MILFSLLFLLNHLVLAAFTNRLKTTIARSPTSFVTTDGASFVVNGSDFRYIGTNAYWIPILNTDQDIWNTFGNISALGIKIVRLWAFNDVDTVPVNGIWFQLVRNDTVSINDGPNGLQRLDTVVQMAEQHGLYLIISLTNNWFPLPLLSSTVQPGNNTISAGNVTSGTNNSLPRNYLSNDYGGMDLYVRQFGLETHDQFYTNPAIINAFMNFTTQVISRYVNSPAIFSWELANDPRCNSTIPASPNCTTETITQWHATMAAYVRSIDPNHLISAGTSGFLCTDCPKLYPLNPIPSPTPSVSPAKAKARRSTAVLKDGISIEGRWVATATRRQQTQNVGPLYDGAYGVDSQDIMNIPDVSFGSFTLFPDQQNYGPTDPNLDSYQNTVNLGIDWINLQAQLATTVGKPSTLAAFGLVSQENAADFVPFNMTTAPYAADALPNTKRAVSTYGVTIQQQTNAYTTWLNVGIASGLSGIVQYQCGQANLTAETGTTIAPGLTGISQEGQTIPTSANSTAGFSPNDGYTTNGNYGIQQDLQVASQNIS